MRKRTSKSASGTPATSSPSGTSAETAGAGKKSKPERKKTKKKEADAEDLGPFGFVVEQIRKMSPEEFRQSLIEAGIIDESGQLTPHYRQPDDEADGKQP